MNKEKIVRKLQQKYPKGKIICLPEENPTEIICELDAAENNPQKSIAISIIDKSLPHVHKKITKIYKVIEGSLKVHLHAKIVELQKGDIITIVPNTIHWAEGNETWIEVVATPRWTNEDHILV